jgi:hypothetical protein
MKMPARDSASLDVTAGHCAAPYVDHPVAPESENVGHFRPRERAGTVDPGVVVARLGVPSVLPELGARPADFHRAEQPISRAEREVPHVLAGAVRWRW